MTLDCRETHDVLDRWLDGELDESAAGRLEAHLAGCAPCRQEADARKRDHRQLAAAFAPDRAAARRVADAVVSQLAASADAPPAEEPAAQPTAARKSGRAFDAGKTVQLLLALAAGFLIAVLVFRPWQRSTEVVQNPAGESRPPFNVTPAGLARMDIAIGPVEYALDRDVPFYVCPNNTSLPSGAVVRTAASARCELNLDETMRLRLNEKTQMRLADERRVELNAGQLWLQLDQAERPYVIDAGEFEISTRQATLDCTATPPNLELLVLEGSASVKGADWQQEVTAGQKLSVVDGKRTHTTPFLDPIVETRWVHDILIQKGPDDAELSERIDRLWGQVGRAKMTNLYEAEIRSLGGHCATPLACYIQSPDSQQEPDRRVAAARLLADIAPPESIPQLIALLSDASGDVRFYAARALERLTAQNFGREPQAWQAESWGACQTTAAQWKAWWETAKERYPGAKETGEILMPRTNLQKKS